MFLYGIITTVLFLAILPFYYFVRLMKGKSGGWEEKLGFGETPNLGGKIIMLHGVSVGEVIALENLVKKIHETFPQYKIVITTGTSTGQEIARKKYSEYAYVTYFPFDFPFCINGFLKRIKPSVVLIAETEIWPNFAYLCSKKNIPLYVINGRMSDSTFKLYKSMTVLFKRIFKYYTGIFTQSEEDRAKLIRVGANPDITRVMNNLKFDVKKSVDKVEYKHDNNRIIVAGSTHKGEDTIIIDAFKELKKQHPDIKLLLVPRHLTRLNEIIEIIKNKELKYGLRSYSLDFTQSDIIILDTIGELGKMYSICEVAFIGGSFNKTGGHNPLEATVFHKPVVSGPSIHNFKDIYSILGLSKAGKVVKNPDELKEYLNKLLSDKEFYQEACKDCKNALNKQQGALDFVIKILSEKLS